jgi:hypothetical protein
MTSATTMTYWWIAMGIGSLLGLATVISQRIQTGRAVRRAVAEEGLLVRHIELRFLTRGPFSAEIGLPGISYSDTLYRVVADDPTGRPHVLWARIPRGWGRPRCTVCRDVAPERTPRGLNAPAFYMLAACLAAALISFIILISTGRVFGATLPGETIWARTVANYAALQTYADSGTVEVGMGSVSAPPLGRSFPSGLCRRVRSALAAKSSRSVHRASVLARRFIRTGIGVSPRSSD